MEGDKKPIVRRPDVLRKLNADHLYMIERGLLGDLPEKLKPPPIGPFRAQATDLVVAKPSGLLSSCLPVVPDSPVSDKVTSSDDENVSPLKKSFSFRDKFSRISFFGKDKPKWKTIVEDERNEESTVHHGMTKSKEESKIEQDNKSNKRFWFFRNMEKRDKQRTPVYMRSKSFEFLPRAIEEEEEQRSSKKLPKNSQSYVFGSSDTMGDAWTSNESLEYISNVYYDNEDGVFLKSIKEFPSESSNNDSSVSTATSVSSANVGNILRTDSVQNVFSEFNKAVELFSENYLSDCEPYTKTKQLTLKQKRKSSSFTSLPSPKVVQVNKVSEVSEDFKKELSRALSVKRAVTVSSPRRGSVTDWFVLEDQANGDTNKYKRGQKKHMNRVRRMSSTKYWITQEECAMYSREQRPPLVIPRITQYRTRPRVQPVTPSYPEEDIPEKGSLRSRHYERLNNWSPTSERSRVDLEMGFKANTDSPPLIRINKRLGGSTENLLTNVRRPNHLQIAASSSGDSLDVELREWEPGYARNRKSRSMVAPKNRMRSPVPAPRIMVTHSSEQPPVIYEGPVKRTKFSDGVKKTKKNWVESYMVLTPTHLLFYKDQRHSYSPKVSRAPGTPPSPAPSPEFSLKLYNAHVVECIHKHTKRYTRTFVLTTVAHDQYLIQDETELGARRWLAQIQAVIHSLYTSTVAHESPTLQYQSSNTDQESLGRTPPASRHIRSKQKAGNSSNEDLSDSTEVSIQKSHVRNRLRKFFLKRPAMDQLVTKGIYKDEPVFGRNLEEVCPAEGPRVPLFVVACVDEIEKNPDNLCTDGLYRASGNLSQVQKIRLEVDQNKFSVIENHADIHVLTGSLKLFFRELKEPLIPYKMFDRVLSACSIKPREARIKEFQNIVQALPQCNRETLKYLLEHLLRVTQKSEWNRMHIANLAIVFGPTLLWAPPEQAHNIAVDCIQQNNVVDILLTDFKEIFLENGSKGKKKT